MIVHIHSIVDLITNSSSEIFMGVNSDAAEIFKVMINGILKAVKSEVTCDDLFEITITRKKPSECSSYCYEGGEDDEEDWYAPIYVMEIKPKEGVDIRMDIMEKLTGIFDPVELGGG